MFNPRLVCALITITAGATVALARPTTHNVMVGPGLAFNPSTINAQSGDTITWMGLVGFHTVTQTVASGSCSAQASPLFMSPGGASVYSWTIPANLTGTFYFKCNPHCGSGMRGTINITAAPPPPCLGDANSDATIDFGDITSILASWGGSGPIGDSDHDGDVEFADVTATLANFGVPCPM